MGKKLTTEEFINRARAVHGDKYDYSKVEYKGNKTKVCIICPRHGKFWQTPAHHIHSGSGCPKCSWNKFKISYSKTTEQFITEARAVHGDKYDYSKVHYTNAHQKVCIVCPKHGEFWQIAREHIRGQGCPVCAGRLKHTAESFVEEARKVHGDKYNYSKVKYKTNKNKVCIICPKHGEFWQRPDTHLFKKSGCPRCAKTVSKAEQEIADWVRSLGFEVIQSYRGWNKKVDK